MIISQSHIDQVQPNRANLNVTGKTNQMPKAKSNGPATGANQGSFVDDFLPYLLSHAYSLLARRISMFAEQEQVSMNEFRVLITLIGNDGLSLRQLAEMMQVKQPTLSRIVDGMVESGMLNRRSAKGDRRRIEIRLTAAGLDKVTPLLHHAKDFEKEALADLGAQDSATLKQILRKLIGGERARIRPAK